MSYFLNLLRVELIALLGLVLSGLAIIIYFCVAAMVSEPSLKLDTDALGFLFGMFGFVIIFGIIPALFFGAPIYTALLLSGRASWISALILGLLPGFVFYFLEQGLAGFAFAAGTGVSLFTHYYCRNQLQRPINSSKQTAAPKYE